MKLTNLLPLFALAAFGCSSNPAPGPTATLSSDQNIEKIKRDPKMPDGLKQIRINTLQRQPGAKP